MTLFQAFGQFAGQAAVPLSAYQLIVPTSVSGTGTSVTIEDNGRVQFTSCTAVQIDGIFSADYDNYLQVCHVILAPGDGNSGVLAQLRTGGVTATASNYYSQYQYCINGSPITALREGPISSVRWAISADVSESVNIIRWAAPALAEPTTWGVTTAWGLTAPAIIDNIARHTLSTAYDGIALSVSGVTMTGAVMTYGMVQ